VTSGNGQPAADDRSYGSGGSGADFVPGRDRPGYGYEPDPDDHALRDALAVLWRRKWIIALAVVIATVSAYMFAARQPSHYSTSGSMFYNKPIDVANPLSGYVDVAGLDRQMASINSLMASPTLRDLAAVELKRSYPGANAPYSVSAAQLMNGTVGTNVLIVTGDSTDPKLAAAGVNAFMAAFAEWNTEQFRKQIRDAIPVIQAQLDRFRTRADKLSPDYLTLKQRLQDTEILKDTASGGYQVLAAAPVPAVPYAPQPRRSAFLGFAVGLLAGIGAAFLVEQYDSRIRKSEDVSRILRLPVLGRIPRISRKTLDEGGLVALRHPSGNVADSFRRMRVDFEHMARGRDVRSVVVTSALMGEGKSMTVANLAVTMAMAGKKVVVVDADLRRPRQHRLFDVPNEVGLSSVVVGRSRLHHSLQAVDIALPQTGEHDADFDDWARGTGAQSRLYVLCSGPLPPNPAEVVASPGFSSVIHALSREADMVIVDSPAMLSVADTAALASRVDGLIFLVDSEKMRKPQLRTAADQLMRMPTAMLGVVLRSRGRRDHGYYYSSSSYYYSYSRPDGTRGRKRRSKSSSGSSGARSGAAPAQTSASASGASEQKQG
jgi:Mrp family chromosome partitioning ATPase/capsular polysaccharide biosynthesis protein